MRKLLEKLAREDHSDADCLMCVVMSHGTKLEDGGLGVFGVDSDIIDIEAAAKSLFSNKNCPTLKNKPKMFFVDACWGNGLMAFTNDFQSQSNSTVSSSNFNICNSICNNLSSIATSSNNPDISDFLFSFSTLPTYVSLRDSSKGNWFIQEFTSVLDEFAETKTLSDIMNKVRQNLMRKTSTFSAQVSVDHWMLSRNVLFTCKRKKLFASSKLNTCLFYFKEDLHICYKRAFTIHQANGCNVLIRTATITRLHPNSNAHLTTFQCLLKLAEVLNSLALEMI